jgi:hypothetical protein
MPVVSETLEKIPNCPRGIFRAAGQYDSWKNLESKISWHCLFNIILLPITSPDYVSWQIIRVMHGQNTIMVQQHEYIYFCSWYCPGEGGGDISPAGQLWLSYSVHFFSLALQRLLQPAFTECLWFSFQSGTFPSYYPIKRIKIMLIEIVSALTVPLLCIILTKLFYFFWTERLIKILKFHSFPLTICCFRTIIYAPSYKICYHHL